ncbi:MAG: NosD domain-containing protein [Pseudomonadota bacterium]
MSRSVSTRPRLLATLAAASLIFFILLLLLPHAAEAAVSPTMYIRATGGDCSKIGTWDPATKTCTLSGDVIFGTTNGIVVDGHGVTVDGAGHTITGALGFNSGVTSSLKSNITVRNLHVSGFRYGVNLITTTGATVTGNTFSGNSFGAFLQNATGSRVYNNDFDSNATQAKIQGGSGNAFSQPAPAGGNWWNGYDAPVEGCNDMNTDYFCDAALAFTGGSDALPWTRQDGWSAPPAPDTDAPFVESIEPSGSVAVGNATLTVYYTDASNIDTASASITLDGVPVAGCAATETKLTCPLAGYSTGVHLIEGSVADILGNTAAIIGTFTYSDDQPPLISELGPLGFVSNPAPTIGASYGDAGTGVDLASVSVTLDGTPLAGCTAGPAGVACPTSGLAQGPHTYVVSAADVSGNTASASATFTLDTVAPAITSVSPSGTIGTTNANILINYSDSGSGVSPAAVAVYVDGARLTACNTTPNYVSCTARSLAQGPHTISGSAGDAAGNTTPISGSFTFSDTAPPVITNMQPPIMVNKTWTTIGASFSDVGVGVDAASVAVYLDGAALSGCTVTSANAACIAYFGEGPHSYQVRVADNAGNVATASADFTMDPNAPTVSKTIYLYDNATGGGCTQVGYWVPSSKTCVVREDLMFIKANGFVFGANGITLDGGGHYITGNNSFAAGITGSLRNGVTVRNLTVKQFRYGGLFQGSQSVSLHHNRFENNTYGLYFSSVSNSTVYNNDFTGNTTRQALVQGGSGNQFSIAAPDGGNHWSNFDAPEEGCDDAGADGFCDAAYAMYGVTDDLAWTQHGWPEPPAYDGLAPEISDIQPSGNINTSAATISAYYTDSGTGVDSASVRVYLDGAPMSGCAITDSSATCEAYGLADGNHTITVNASDNMGNTGSASGSFGVDTTGPVINNIQPAAVNTSSATLSAYVSDAVSGVDSASLDVYVEGASVSGCALAGTTASCSVYGLSDGSHAVRVSASDLAGNSATANAYLTVDATAPSITNLLPTGTVNKTSAVISAYLADPGSGVDTASVAVYLDGSQLTTGCTITSANASCNVYNLTETAHTYTIRASDMAGNSAAADGYFTVDTRITTKYIRDNATGGDCAQIGYWTAATKTCTLVSGYTFSGNGLIIESNGVTLDGGGYTLTGAGGFTSGVSASLRSNVTIRNVRVVGFRNGINVLSSNNTVIRNNVLQGNTFGVYLSNDNNTQVYRNNFNANTTQASVSGGSNNVFSLALPTGGNWWSNFDTPGEGCSDAGPDGYCDAAYTFTGGSDALPSVLEYPFPAG